MTDSTGSAAQVRIIADQVAEAAITKFVAEHPQRAEVPAFLKWMVGVAAALFASCLAAMAVWLVSTVSDMQVTLARMDERLAGQSTAQDSRFGELDRRVSKLEMATQHREGGQ